MRRVGKSGRNEEKWSQHGSGIDEGMTLTADIAIIARDDIGLNDIAPKNFRPLKITPKQSWAYDST